MLYVYIKKRLMTNADIDFLDDIIPDDPKDGCVIFFIAFIIIIVYFSWKLYTNQPI